MRDDTDNSLARDNLILEKSSFKQTNINSNLGACSVLILKQTSDFGSLLCKKDMDSWTVA